MKRSIGSLFAGLLSLVFALSGFATTYSGNGTWLSSEGTKGEYTVGASIETDANENVSINQTWVFGDKSFDFNIVIQKTGESFYDIINAENSEVIGAGYCFPLGTDAKLCHSESVVDDTYIESTIKITSANIYRMGSSTMFSTGEKVIWMDELQPSAASEPTEPSEPSPTPAPAA